MIFVLALLLCLTTATDFYWRHPHADVLAPNANILLLEQGNMPFKEFLAMLKAECSKRPECLAFTNEGILKSSLEMVKSSDTELYVKNTSPAASEPNIWPLPQSFSSGSSTVSLSTNFGVSQSPHFSDLDKLVAWFNSYTFDHRPQADSSNPILSQIQVSVTNPNAPLQVGVDEGYTLIVPNTGMPATLKANTYYGAVNGLQTFSQLITFNFTSRSYQIHGAPWMINDFARFAHRGLLLDTSRHFEPIPVVKKVIDSMSFGKLNVFHWHVVDSQSFPFESRSNPRLWMGAYSEYEKYTQEDIQDVVEYARLRNVRTMIEFDTPGHASSWCTGYPEICPSLQCRQPLNPSTEATFSLLTRLFLECTGGKQQAGLFPDHLIHLGGDEVDTSCWTQTPSINNWLKSQNMTAKDGYLYFVNRVIDIVLAQERDPVNWEEVYNNFGTRLNRRSIVHAWKDKATVAKAVKDGFRSLNSDGWYLDHLNDLWTDYYNNDPMENVNDPAQQKLVLGGETCMWGETVDPSDIFSTIWPRAAAVSERLWSSRTVTSTVSALPRYEYFRCLLNRRGINAAPANNKVARQSPPGPGSCLNQ